jgi:hypothetical protein
VANILFTPWMTRVRPGLAWTSVTVRFPRRAVLAVVHLSTYEVQNGETFEPFKPRFAYSYIITEETPWLDAGGVAFPNPDRLVDAQVHLTTDWLTFQLEAEDVVASAVGIVFDIGSDGRPPLRVAQKFDFAIHDGGGEVVALHRELQLEGGPAIDPASARQEAVARASHRSGRELDAVEADLDAFPTDARLRVDPGTTILRLA